MSISPIRDLHVLRGRLDLLPALAALLERRSVTAAALDLSISQPAMSRVLAQLRVAFTDPLLVRSGSEMALTPRAIALRAPVVELLAAAAALFRHETFDASTASHTFRAVIPDVLAAYLMPRLLDRLAREAPQCRLELLPWRSSAERTRAPNLIVTSGIDAYPSMRMIPLYEDHDVLARREQPLPGQDPLQMEHVAVVPAGAGEDLVDRWLADGGRARRIVTSVPTYLLALHLVATTGVSAILPHRLVTEVGARLGVMAFELTIPQTPDRICMLYPPTDEADAAATWLRQFVRAACAPVGGEPASVPAG
jgi:DNA-binding transcriptional LysR family regulator